MKRTVLLFFSIIAVLMMTSCGSKECTCACCTTQTGCGTINETAETTEPKTKCGHRKFGRQLRKS